METITTLTEEAKNDIGDLNYLVPILEEIEQLLTDIKSRLDNLEKI